MVTRGELEPIATDSKSGTLSIELRGRVANYTADGVFFENCVTPDTKKLLNRQRPLIGKLGLLVSQRITHCQP